MLEEDNDLSSFESALRTLRPVPGNVDPIAAAFTAGRRTRQRSVRRWQCAAAVALMLGFASHLPRPSGMRRPGLPQPLAQSSRPIVPALSDQSLQFLHQTARDRGIDALPQVRLPSVQSIRTAETL